MNKENVVKMVCGIAEIVGVGVLSGVALLSVFKWRKAENQLEESETRCKLATDVSKANLLLAETIFKDYERTLGENEQLKSELKKKEKEA